MRDIVRLVATGIIWSAVAIILTSGGGFTGEMVPLAAIMGIGATISTGMIWYSPSSAHSEEHEAASLKSKRDHRLTRLVDQLDEDDVYQLEELLAARRDDEIVGRN
ncbi:MAG: hypothetical protein K8J31_31850 [Anaerolineae bacterium]|nr:hypothetical protein [Anaerolineae bacterium]